ncbi:MAG: hypothetical protein J0H69_04680 [Burkholderiales bacterium]|nr:hypothetical protein [Burkholderiales bacterium]
MQIRNPIIIGLVGIVVVGLYASQYMTAAHRQAAALLRSPPHSMGPLVIVKSRWSGEQAELWYTSFDAPGQGKSVWVQVDTKTGMTVVK